MRDFNKYSGWGQIIYWNYQTNVFLVAYYNLTKTFCLLKFWLNLTETQVEIIFKMAESFCFFRCPPCTQSAQSLWVLWICAYSTFPPVFIKFHFPLPCLSSSTRLDWGNYWQLDRTEMPSCWYTIAYQNYQYR